MAIEPMTRAEAGTIASSSDYNTVLDNVEDLDARVSPLDGRAAWPKLLAQRTTEIDAFVNGHNVSFQAFPTNVGGWTFADNNQQLICPQGGLYLFAASVAWSVSSSSSLGIYLCKNGYPGGTYAVGAFELAAGSEGQNPRSISGVVSLNAGDWLALRCYSIGTATAVRGTLTDAPYGGTYVFAQRVN